jgi:hypothetical protein
LFFFGIKRNWLFLGGGGRIRKNDLHIKFHENQSSGNRVVPCGRTDRRYKANSWFQNFANAPKTVGEEMRKKESGKG